MNSFPKPPPAPAVSSAESASDSVGVRMLYAFDRYLLSLPRPDAVLYVYECMRDGDASNQAWALMESVHGEDWSCEPKDLPQKIFDAIEVLAVFERAGAK